jgi:hypothetical protein
VVRHPQSKPGCVSLARLQLRSDDDIAHITNAILITQAPLKETGSAQQPATSTSTTSSSSIVFGVLTTSSIIEKALAAFTPIFFQC